MASNPFWLDSVNAWTKSYPQLADGALLAIRAVVGSFRLHQAPGLSGSYSCMRRGARARGQSHTTACAPRGRPSGHSKSFGVSMSRYMAAMANLIFPKVALAAIGPGPGWRRPPKTRSESLGTFPSYLTLLHSIVALDRENHVACCDRWQCTHV